MQGKNTGFHHVYWNDCLKTAEVRTEPVFGSVLDAEIAAHELVANKRSFFVVTVHEVGRHVTRSGALVAVRGCR